MLLRILDDGRTRIVDWSKDDWLATRDCNFGLTILLFQVLPRVPSIVISPTTLEPFQNSINTMTLTLFGAVSDALYLVADAIRVQSREKNEASQWDIEKQFCLTLRATLESARAWSSSDGGFLHDQELNMLLQAALEPLLTVFDVLEPYINDLRRGCEDDAYKEDIAQMERTLEQSVMVHIKGLTTQVSRLTRGINALLLLFIMYVFSSRI